MALTPLSRQRLLNQQLVRPRFTAAAELVHWFGAVQAQDSVGALWALGLRLPRAREADIEGAIADRRIVRTWPMRGTLHYVAAPDVRWMLRLLTPRVVARSAGRYRELELDEAVFTRSRRSLEKALRGGRVLTRPETYAVIARGGVPTEGQRGLHIVGHLAQQGHICFGPRRGKQPTFVLLEEWLPGLRDLAREEALGTLATRYFASHGPATLHDFAWWSGLIVKEAQQAVAIAGSRLRCETREGVARWRAGTPAAGKWTGPVAALLPPWDELLVAYRDRESPLGHLRGLRDITMMIGNALIVVDGQVRGAWKRRRGPSSLRIELDLWTPLSAAERRAVEGSAARYGRFLGEDAVVTPSTSASRRSPS